MLINIASFNVCTMYPFAWSPAVPVVPPDRGNDENIEHYLERIVLDKLEMFKSALCRAVSNNKRKGVCLFFSVPEFFWNISPYALWSKEDVAATAEYYMNNLPGMVSRVIEAYPENEFGKIILLCGSAGTLIETEKNYDAINYILSIDNFNVNADGTHSISMWPKTQVASFDYGYSDYAGEDIYFYMGMPGHPFSLRVNAVGTSVAEHNTDSGYGPSFANGILPGVPFAISLCADYMTSADFRQDEWLDKQPKLHFLLACGMPFSESKEYSPSVQFTIRNDGFSGSIEQPRAGGCGVKVVESGYITNDVDPVSVEDDVYLYELEIK